jgi:hypothetical protein
VPAVEVGTVIVELVAPVLHKKLEPFVTLGVNVKDVF